VEEGRADLNLLPSDPEAQTISLHELLTNLYTVQANMGAKNSHKSVIRMAILALMGQAEQIAMLQQASDVVSVPMVQTTD
jgi:hypothetical protein